MSRHTFRNPWVETAVYGETAAAFGEQGVIFQEYVDAEEHDTETCPNGHTAYYKPTVGAVKCPQCGLMRVHRLVSGKPYTKEAVYVEEWI